MLKAAMLVVVMAITKLPISAAIKNDEGDVSDNVIRTTFLKSFNIQSGD